MPTKLGGGGGIYGPLGIKVPKRSSRFYDPGNISNQLASGTISDDPVNKGRAAPTYDDPAAAFTIATGGSTFGRAFWPSRSQQWTANIDTYFGATAGTSDIHSLIYYHLATNHFYFLVEANSTAYFVKLDASETGGTFTTIATIGSATAPDLYDMVRNNRHNPEDIIYISPLDVNNPDTGAWEFIYKRNNPAGDPTKRTVYDFGTMTLVSSEPLKYDAAGTNQDVEFCSFYISKDKTVLFGRLESAGLGSTDLFNPGANYAGLSFIVCRGNSMFHILASDISDFLRVPVVSRAFYNIGLWGEDDILFFGEAADTEEAIGAGKIIDRADFDRFLNEICDLHGAAPGEAYY